MSQSGIKLLMGVRVVNLDDPSGVGMSNPRTGAEISSNEHEGSPHRVLLREGPDESNGKSGERIMGCAFTPECHRRLGRKQIEQCQRSLLATTVRIDERINQMNVFGGRHNGQGGLRVELVYNAKLARQHSTSL